MTKSKGIGKWRIKCSAPDCKFVGGGTVYGQKTKAERLSKQHGGWPGHSTTVEEIKALSKTIRVGDRIKLKEECGLAVETDCKKAGWNINRRAIHEVRRIDHFGPGGSTRLVIDVPPFMLRPSDVMLAWNSDDERRAGLGIRS